MTTAQPGGLLLDTTALAAIASSRSMSSIIAAAPQFDETLYAPVTCLDAADRIRPGIARHVGRIPFIEPVDLTYADLLDLRDCAPNERLDVAHVIVLAGPSPLRPNGMTVVTVIPGLYTGFDIRTRSIGD